MILVLNKHKDPIPPGAVYIGRPSIYGNPYMIGRDGDRQQVIRKFEEYFDARISDDPKFAEAVERLREAKALVCFCAPENCHGDVIVLYLSRTQCPK